MSERLNDRIIGVVLILWSVWYMYETTNFRPGLLVDPVGPRHFPVALGALMALFSIYLLVKPDKNPTWPRPEGWLRMGLVTLSFIAYAYLLVPVGFIIATTFEMFALGNIFRGPVWKSLIASVLFSIALYVLFDRLLGLSLPTGQLIAPLLGGK